MWKFPTHLWRRCRRRVGQSTTEYVIATAGSVLVAFYVLQLFGEWMGWYFYDMTAVVCLPIP